MFHYSLGDLMFLRESKTLFDEKSTRFNSMPLLASLQTPIKEFKLKSNKLFEDSKKSDATELDKIKSRIFSTLWAKIEFLINDFNKEKVEEPHMIKESLLRLSNSLYALMREYFNYTSILNSPRRQVEYLCKLIGDAFIVGAGFGLFYTSPLMPLGVFGLSIGLFSLKYEFYNNNIKVDSARIFLNLTQAIIDLRDHLSLEFENITIGPTHYEILGISNDASLSVIKTAYKQLALVHHPDKSNGSDEMIKKINNAYEILRDPEKRTHYDYEIKVSKSNLSKPIFQKYL